MLYLMKHIELYEFIHNMITIYQTKNESDQHLNSSRKSVKGLELCEFPVLKAAIW